MRPRRHARNVALAGVTGLAASAALVWGLGMTGWEAGHATRYAETLMHEVAANRNMPVADCMVAYDLARLGDFVWVRSRGTGRLLYCQVTDVSAPKDRARHVRANLIELDFSSARQICVDHDGPWRLCRVAILK